MSIEQIDESITKIPGRQDAEAILRKLGINVVNKNAGDIMLLGAQHG
jgi:hypothetical protein